MARTSCQKSIAWKVTTTEPLRLNTGRQAGRSICRAFASQSAHDLGPAPTRYPHTGVVARTIPGHQTCSGIPCLPRPSGKQHIFDLLNVPENTGMSLTENRHGSRGLGGRLLLLSSTVQAFTVGKLSRRQVEDYAKAGLLIKEVERFIPPIWPTMIDNLGIFARQIRTTP